MFSIFGYSFEMFYDETVIIRHLTKRKHINDGEVNILDTMTYVFI